MSVHADGWLNLEGLTCVITGAGGGIGRAVATEFALAGANAVLLDRELAGCAQTEKVIASLGGTAMAVACDVSDPKSVSSAARATLETFGRCDVLVNNAGVLRPGNLDSLSLDDWNLLLQINLTGYLLCAQAFGQDMLKRGSGAIVHIASISASQPQAFSGAYSPSKAAVAMLSRQLAFEWGPRGVRSNVVSPGLVRTPLSEEFYQNSSVLRRREEVVPVRRIGSPKDIADAAVFLSSERASYINGQDIVVDGGLSQTLMSHVPRPGYD
jgi:NAD(P)-dependent dehydrogenase (short-subunit alcohol dehydrogenase family)